MATRNRQTFGAAKPVLADVAALAQVPLKSNAAYLALLRSRLAPALPNGFTCLDGWAGCGGLSLGFEAAGFEVTGYEMNADAVKTYNANLQGVCDQVTLDEDTDWPQADCMIAGPPCQPFSVLGNQDGSSDPRNGFPAFVTAVKAVKPKVWLFENVTGLMGKNRSYYDHILARLRVAGYRASPAILNASHFGVPQNRRRLVVIGTKEKFVWPTPPGTHVSAGMALGALPRRPLSPAWRLTSAQSAYIQRYEEKSKCKHPRDLHMDRPARTLTCRNLADATADMHRIKLPNGERRRLSVTEAARLQSFPPGFQFFGNWRSRMTQIGNAVPPLMARYLGDAVLAALNPSRAAPPPKDLRPIAV